MTKKVSSDVWLTCSDLKVGFTIMQQDTIRKLLDY